MTTANDKQVGGEHYQSEYQHWDYVPQAELDYHQGCATKYLRFRKKNGMQDLQKLRHYVEKLQEKQEKRRELSERFGGANGLTAQETALAVAIATSDFDKALRIVDDLIFEWDGK
jgi:hypothetical protein